MRRKFIVTIEWKKEWTAEDIRDWISRAIAVRNEEVISPDLQFMSVHPKIVHKSEKKS